MQIRKILSLLILKLVGASYHLFFAGFMGIVALIFAIYMRFYQEQHIIQEESKQ